MIRKIPGLPFLTIKTRADEDSYSSRVHSHREVSLGYIRSGDTVISVRSEEYLLRRGDVVLIPAGTAHLCTPRDRETFRFDMLYFDRDWWEDCLDCSAEDFPVLAFPASAELAGLFRLIREDDGSADGLLHEEVVRTALLPVRDKFFTEQEERSDWEDRLEEIHREICQMPQVGSSLDEWAERAGMGKFTLIRKYAARYGLTPHCDVINMRIQRALLLFESDMSLTDIALECGFSDQSHFIRHFRRYTGSSPGEYRAALR
ncbi:MAG: AraC family transcriptional regulator [Spirochaetales bacterium]|nr:AraC family transcriptional regulator [Spirochaetales bacterium]